MSAAESDTVIVRIVVTRQVLEEREDGDYHVVKSETVSEREWVEDRKAALRDG